MIRVSLPQIFPPALLAVLDDPEGLAERVVSDVATAAALFWRKRASQELRSTAGDYQRGVQDPEYMGRGRAQVVLLGRIPNMVENGWDGGDQRQWLCGPDAPNRKPVYRRDPKTGRPMELLGWKNTVPFRHSFGGGYQSGSPVDQLYREPGENSLAAVPDFILDAEESGLLAREIFAEAKRLSPTTTAPGGGTDWGDTMIAGMAPKIREIHATDPFAGMVRQEKTYEAATQNQYTTFRTISTANQSDAQSARWQHPGIEPRHLILDVRDRVRKLATSAFRRAVARAVA